MSETDEIRAAITKLARGGSEHDAARSTLIARAVDQKVADLVPDNWRADGSLKESRDTANDVFDALCGVVTDAYSGSESWYTWVQDWYGSGSDEDPWTVVFQANGDLWAAPFTYDGEDKIVLGEAIKVRPVTSYVARAAAPMLEWRKNKANELRGKTMERRTFDVSDMELRTSDDGVLHLTGYASVTETPYDVGFYEETIARNAFTRTLSEMPDVQLLVNHTGLPLARTARADHPGTMTLEERERGLWVDAKLDPEDPDVQSLRRKMERGDIDQMSFAFQATDSDWSDDFTQRRIKTVSIHRGDVSVVNMGANSASTATMRSQDAALSLSRGGSDALLTALTEWRDRTLVPVDQRTALSEATTETLSQLANVVSPAGDSAGDSGDESAPLLAAMVSMPVPSEPAPDANPVTELDTRTAVLPDHTTRAKQRLAALSAGGR